MKKLRKHGYKNWLGAIERDCAPGHSPHSPRIIYNQSVGFRVRSCLSPLGEGDIVAFSPYEPYGTSRSEYLRAVKNINEEGIK